MLMVLSSLTSLVSGTWNRLCLTSQKAHRKNEAEAPKDHDIHSKQDTKTNHHGIEQSQGSRNHSKEIKK
jgi:hypothetical protein